MAYDQSDSASSTATDGTSIATATNSEKTEAQIFRQIMELMRAYSDDGQSGQSALSALISTSA
jgi:hypothetical protein